MRVFLLLAGFAVALSFNLNFAKAERQLHYQVTFEDDEHNPHGELILGFEELLKHETHPTTSAIIQAMREKALALNQISSNNPKIFTEYLAGHPSRMEAVKALTEKVEENATRFEALATELEQVGISEFIVQIHPHISEIKSTRNFLFNRSDSTKTSKAYAVRFEIRLDDLSSILEDDTPLFAYTSATLALNGESIQKALDEAYVKLHEQQKKILAAQKVLAEIYKINRQSYFRSHTPAVDLNAITAYRSPESGGTGSQIRPVLSAK